MKTPTKFNKKTDTKKTDVSAMMAKSSRIFTRRQTCTTMCVFGLAFGGSFPLPNALER
jgi:hypothetical protein